MSFIVLTAEDTGRTILVRTDSIVAVIDCINDDKPTRHTSKVLLAAGATLHVHETKATIVHGFLGVPLTPDRRVADPLLACLVEKYGYEEGFHRFQAGEEPP